LANIETVTGDLTSEACPVECLLNNCEVIFHCAGEIRDLAAMKPLHLDGTKLLLRAALKEAAQKRRSIHWVQLSSVGAYGGTPRYSKEDRIVTEETPPEPIGVYEVTKTQSDEMLVEAAKTGLLSYSIVRPSNVIGPGMPNQSLRSLAAMIHRRLFFYIGRPGAVATYVHVDDVVEVLRLCATDARAKGEIFNISNDCLLEETVQGIALAVGVPPPQLRIPEWLVRSIVCVASKVIRIPLTQQRINAMVQRTRYPYHKVERELGFAPRIYVPHVIGEILTKGDRPGSPNDADRPR
jgi:nucleoside-diphosphate-sugar epimerase